MDTKAYIQSGIIESYVLGLANAQEIAEVELYSQQYPEIKNAVDEFGRIVENHAFENAVAPPAETKQKLITILVPEFASAQTQATIIPLQSVEKASVKISPLRYLAAASVILLVASTALNFYFYSTYKSTSDKYQALLTERNSLQANNEIFQTKLSGLEESMRVMQNPDVKVIKLTGQPGKENNLAAVYWDIKTKDVYLMPTNMDATPADKQYQLWAIVDGKPVNAGLISNCNGLCKMDIKIPNAQAFAVTLEQKGGSKSPTMPIYVLGKV